jgi:1-aminocyclopropane-1-carboxylate deaminase/D-cysteine desulfhydrase-like pyridoxal-dependent ACC family enzyme
VGGSNALGTWGYIEGVNELIQQQLISAGPGIDSIVVATGSGGTLAGIVLGLVLYYHHYAEQQQQQTGILHHRRPVVHAVGVCDDPNYFYKKLDQILEEMGYYSTATDASTTLRNEIKDWVKIHQGKGRGYAQSTPEEMEFVQQFAQCTGIALDPVYTGKALYHFVHEVVKNEPETYRNSRVMFWHTGGSLGLQVRSTELMQSLKEVSPVHKLDAYRKKDLSHA